MAKYYIDTSIWIDYYENRKDRFRPLGVWAFDFFKKINENKDIILYSGLVISELEKFYSPEKIVKIMSVVDSTMLIGVVPNDEQIAEAESIKIKYKVPFQDAIHAVLARDNEAILISRDKHFYIIKIANIKKPEEII